MTKPARIRWEHPEKEEEVAFELSADERETVEQACEYLGLDLDRLIKAAFAWGKDRQPEVTETIKQRKWMRTHLTNRNVDDKYTERAKSELMKNRVVNFSEFVIEQEPSPRQYQPGERE